MARRGDGTQAPPSLAILAVLAGVLLLGAGFPAMAQLGASGAQPDKNAPIVFRADEVEYDESSR